MREEDFRYKKLRYSEVRVIVRRIIARSDCIEKFGEYLNHPKGWQSYINSLSLDYYMSMVAV